MFTSFDKALAALVMAAIFMLNEFGGLDIGFDEETVTALVAVVTPILVYLVPNRAGSR